MNVAGRLPAVLPVRSHPAGARLAAPLEEGADAEAVDVATVRGRSTTDDLGSDDLVRLRVPVVTTVEQVDVDTEGDGELAPRRLLLELLGSLPASDELVVRRVEQFRTQLVVLVLRLDHPADVDVLDQDAAGRDNGPRVGGFDRDARGNDLPVAGDLVGLDVDRFAGHRATSFSVPMIAANRSAAMASSTAFSSPYSR